MIISISGGKGQGKDTVGKLIQLLTNDPGKYWLEDITQEKLNQYFNSESVIDVCPWQIKKWAYKLKQIASILTGIDIEKWEDEEFKNSYMEEEWIGNWTDYDSGNSVPTYRLFLQKLGTEAIRDGLHKNAWVNGLMSKYDNSGGHPYNMCSNPKDHNSCLASFIITDTRFTNELQAIKDRGGICIKVNRDSVETNDSHPSETAWRTWEFDYVIENNAGFEELVVEVQKMLKHFNIL